VNEQRTFDEKETSAQKIGVFDLVRRVVKVMKYITFGGYERWKIYADGTKFVFEYDNVRVAAITSTGNIEQIGIVKQVDTIA